MTTAASRLIDANDEIVIEIAGLTKLFGRFQALQDINLSFTKGEIHSLVGQNGAGKSTLLGILSGRLSPSSGSIDVYGHALTFGDPRFSRHAGIATIYQELTIVPSLSAVANVFLGQILSRFGFISEAKMHSRFLELCVLMDVNINPVIEAGKLSVADQQIIEIMRGLQLNAKILILDEPTASLAPPERESLFRVLDVLRNKGITIIYVSHYLDEVLHLSDTVTVFRNGRMVATRPKHEWNHDSLVTTMLGDEALHDMSEAIGKKSNASISHTEILRAIGVTVPGVLKSVEITIHQGEVTGIGGLLGSGRSTLVRALAGLEPKSFGELWIHGMKASWPRSPAEAIKLGIVLAPEDRKHQGLVLGMSSIDNVNMISFGRISRLLFINAKLARKIADDITGRFGLTRPVHTLCKHLSGGNQQKVLLAKAYNCNPKILIVDEPTRGIDIGAKIEVLKNLRELANQGMGILVISSELEEVVAVSDRVLVISKGEKVKELNSHSEISVPNILHAAFNGGHRYDDESATSLE